MNNLKDFSGSLKAKAFKSANSLGRRSLNGRDQDDVYYGVIDPFLIDREKIRLSKSFRKLADKTQVFPTFVQSNVRNRLIHTNDVVNLASTWANILGLNVGLAEAIAYGHDIGHVPFGHQGEKLISTLSGKKFSHTIMGVVNAQKVERKGLGLNLTYEVLEGILNHSRGNGNLFISNGTEEATLVMYADKIAYTMSDLNDALRVGFIKENDIPKEFLDFFGPNQRERIFRISLELIRESSEKGKVSFSDSDLSINFSALKKWMYENVYFALNKTEENISILEMFKRVSNFIFNKFNGTKIDPFFVLAVMTDNEVYEIYNSIVSGRQKIKGKDTVLKYTYGFMETVNNFGGRSSPNIFDPDLQKDFFHN